MTSPAAAPPQVVPLQDDRERAAFLAGASHALASTLDLQQTLGTIARIAVPSLADIVTVYLVQEGGTVQQVVEAATDSKVEGLMARLRALGPYVDREVAQVAATGVRSFLKELPAPFLASLPGERGELIRQIQPTSTVFAPMIVRGEVIGIIGAGMIAASGRRFEEADARMFEELALRAAVALDNARLYARAVATADRLKRLQEIAESLSRALTVEQVADAVLEQGMLLTSAKTGGVWASLPGSADLDLVRQRGWDPKFIPMFARVTRDERSPVGWVFSRGVPLWLSSRSEYAAGFPEMNAQRIRDGGLAVAAIPLEAEGTTVGVLSFGFEEDRVIPVDERELLLALARHCAQALRRAQLYDGQRRLNERVALLAEVGQTLSSLDYEKTLRSIIGVCVPRLGDFGFFDVIEGDGVRRMALAFQDPRRQAILDQSQWARNERTDMNLCALSSGEPAVHPDIDEAWLQKVAVAPAHLEVMRSLSFGSMLTVPLRYHSELLGALTLFFDACSGADATGAAARGRRHEAQDVEVAHEVARRAAAALVNARLYRDAQSAIQLRDDFLSVASHELRTPLTAADLHINALLRSTQPTGSEDAAALKLRHKLERVDVQLGRLRALVEQLLDVGRMGGDKVELDRAPMDLAALVVEVASRFEDAARQAEVTLQVDVVPAVGEWDRSRLDQIVTNLVANALKYGPGKPVQLRLRAVDAEVRLAVADQGIGISPEDHARIFERFERASSVKNYGGLGLGLWIVREIARLHGGTVSVTSERGAGSTFTVVLPR